MTYRAIIFDLDNTLIDRDAALERYLSAWGPQLDERDLDRIRKSDCHGYSPRLAFASWFVDHFEARLSRATTGPELWSHMRRHLAEFVEVDPAVSEMLDRLSETSRLGLISNGSSLNQRAKLAQTGLEPFFSSVTISQEVGMKKPAQAIFQRALRELDVDASDAIYVGDHPLGDILGARHAGLSTAWLKLGRKWPQAIRPDLTLDTILDLEQAVLSS